VKEEDTNSKKSKNPILLNSHAVHSGLHATRWPSQSKARPIDIRLCTI
jgi:hypothetical protein